MTIQVTIKTVYGKDLIYPVDDKAKLFTALVGMKTLTTKHLDLIKALGFTIELINGYSLTKEGN
jgi:hypothetical protein